MHKINKCLVALVGVLALSGCQNQVTNHVNKHPTSTIETTKKIQTKQNQQAIDQIAPYQSGESPVIEINHNQSTLDPNDWQTNQIKYAPLDRLNRTSSPVTAYLEARNVANDELRQEQTVKPTGWHQKFDSHHQAILNRGHIIAYSLSKGINDDGQYDARQQSGDQNNPKNLFTETAFTNQRLQTVYESKVRDALKAGKKVIYQVQPIFKGSDLMPFGVHLQAISTDKSLNFNIFLYNVQPEYRFNYQTGTSQIDHQMKVPTIKDSPNFNNH